MTARNSAPTERAIERVMNGETMYAAAKAEGLVYTTVWNAMQRKNGAPPRPSTHQKSQEKIRDLCSKGIAFQAAFVVADSFARSSEEYRTLHAPNADELLRLGGDDLWTKKAK